MASSLRRNPFNRIPMGIITAHLRFTFAIMLCVITCTATAQTDTIPIVKNTIKANRIKTYNNIINNSITKNLNLPLTDSTEENWEDAFYAMELINYKQLWVLQKVKIAFDGIEKRSVSFQRALLELAYTNYAKVFLPEIFKLAKQPKTIGKILAMCVEYIIQSGQIKQYKKQLIEKVALLTVIADSRPVYFESIIQNRLSNKQPKTPHFKEFFNKNYLSGETLIFSLQRKNRNYPGIAIVRDNEGNFITEPSGKIFFVTQLARSITNLPGYLTNGNTPQGVLKMTGFSVSKINDIGPTTNIQLLMPNESSEDLIDSNSIDFAEKYEAYLPKSWKNYFPIMEAYHAGSVGRTEIIAHGTTVDPEYYKGQTYYPYTPTQGCLCTKEIWSDKDGKRIISDQQKLVDAVKKAGGANGYLIVIEIDDQQKPVSINEILPYLKTKNK